MPSEHAHGQSDMDRLDDRLRHVELTIANLTSGLDWHVRSCDQRAREVSSKMDAVGRTMEAVQSQISGVRDMVGRLESGIQNKLIAALLACVGGLLIALSTIFFHQVFPHAG